MGMHQVRNARGEKLYQGRPTTDIEHLSDQKTDVYGGAKVITDDQLHAPKKDRPFDRYPNTPPPGADQDFYGVEGPSRGTEPAATSRKDDAD